MIVPRRRRRQRNRFLRPKVLIHESDASGTLTIVNEPLDPIIAFGKIVNRPESEVDLAKGALAIAAGADPELDFDYWLLRLEELAWGVKDLNGLTDRVFHQLGFKGNSVFYDDPQNSFLNRVIERRTGIPITLSVLLIEVGRRAGVPLEGIGMPGHFLVRSPETGRYLDAFDKGEILDQPGLIQRFRSTYGAHYGVDFDPQMLAPVTRRQILTRMLNNLAQLYRTGGNGQALEWVLRMKLAIPETSPQEVVALGEALALQGKVVEGAAEIEEVAARHPELEAGLAAVARLLRASLN
jgi:regulator of sirC expression with transglutaminase-like and TPR domain